MTDQPKFKYGDEVRIIGGYDDGSRRTIIGAVPDEVDRWAYAIYKADGGFYGVDWAYGVNLELVPDVRQETIDKFIEWWRSDKGRSNLLSWDGTIRLIAAAAYDAGWIKDVEP